MLERGQGGISYTLELSDLTTSRLLFICVGTPPTHSGDAISRRLDSARRAARAGSGENPDHEEHGFPRTGEKCASAFSPRARSARLCVSPSSWPKAAIETSSTPIGSWSVLRSRGKRVAPSYAGMRRRSSYCDVPRRDDQAGLERLPRYADKFINEIAKSAS